MITTAAPDPDADTWVLTLRGTDGTPSVEIRVRKLLKAAARLGLRCTRVASIEPSATPIAAPNAIGADYGTISHPAEV